MTQEPTPSAPTPPLHIYLLGDFRIERGDEPLTLRHRNARNLLAHLLLHPQQRHLREQLADLLWPDAPPARVGRNLSDALYRLRQALGDEWLLVSRDAIAIQPDAPLWVDVWAFETAISTNSRAAWEQAIALYTGDLLPDLYDDWVQGRRTTLQQQHETCLHQLGEWAEAEQLWERAHAYYQQLIEAAVLNEAGYRGLMRTAAARGRFTEAFAIYEKLTQTLAQDLDVEPDQQSQTLFTQLQAEWEINRQQLPVNQRWQRPLIGRIAERAAIINGLDAARQGRGGIIAVEGEAGMGKSSLLAEIVKSANWRQLTVVQGSAEAYTAVSPFSPLTDSLSASLDGLRAAQLETMLAGETLAAAAVLHEPWQPLATLPDLPMDAAHKRFFQALTAICQTLTELAPHLLVLDDLHWAGLDFWQALDALMPMLSHSRLLIVLAYRRSELENSTAWQFLDKWDRAGQLHHLALEPLSQDEIRQLLPATQQAEAAAIWAGTGGNPYFVTEVLYSLAQGGAAYRETAVSRAADLPPSAQTALAAAAIIGNHVPYKLWATVTPLSPIELAQAGDELVQHYLLEPISDGYQFTHDLVRDAILAQLEPTARQDLHQQTAAALDTSQTRARAYHLQQAGENGRSAALYAQIGHADMVSHAYEDAVIAFDLALHLAENAQPDTLLDLNLQLIRACEVTGNLQRQNEALQAALPLAEANGDSNCLILLLLERAILDIKQGSYETGEAGLQRALTLAQTANDASAQGEIQQQLGDLALRRADNVEACAFFETAVSLAHQTSNMPLEGRALDGLGYALTQRSRPLAEVSPLFERAIALHQQSNNPLDEARTLVNYFSVLQNAGAWDRVLAMADTVIGAQQAINYRRGEAIAYQTQGVTAMQLGDHTLAEHSLAQALAGFEAVGEPLGATITKMSLGTVKERQGDTKQAAVFYEAAITDAQQLNSALFIAFAQQFWGGMLVETGAWGTAVPMLQAAAQFWASQGDHNFQLRCESLLGLAHLGLGQADEAKALAQAGWETFQSFDTIHGEEREHSLWFLAQLCDGCGMVAETAVLITAAYAELQKQASMIADHAMRHRFFAHVPPNRAIVQAYDAQQQVERTRCVQLAHQDAPLGRTLQPDELMQVTWTISAPEDEAINNKTERRHHQIKRLLTEATVQHAIPTDDDLATALGVSRRTILRDRQTLVNAGIVWPSRSRLNNE